MPFDCLCVSTTSSVLTAATWAVVAPFFNSELDTQSNVRTERLTQTKLELLASIEMDMLMKENCKEEKLHQVEYTTAHNKNPNIQLPLASKEASASVLKTPRTQRIEELESSLAEHQKTLARMAQLQKTLSEQSRGRVRDLEEHVQSLTCDMSGLQEQLRLNRALIDDLDDQVEDLDDQAEVLRWEKIHMKGFMYELESQHPDASRADSIAIKNALRPEFWEHEFILDAEIPAHRTYDADNLDKRIRDLAGKLGSFPEDPMSTNSQSQITARSQGQMTTRSQPESEPGMSPSCSVRL